MSMTDVLDAPYNTGDIKLHGEAGFAGMRAAGRLAAQCLDMLTPHVVPGAITDDLDRLAREFILDHGALPACLGYRGYTKTVCISVNHVVCHGIPSERALREGDIANIDVTVIVDGWHGDHSRMQRGLDAVRPGGTTGDIGHAIATYVEAQRCSVVRDFCGHGLGQVFHDAPNIMHFGQRGTGVPLRPGMFFTIEPMVNLGKYQVKVLADGWTAVTRDKSLSAQCEHSIGVTDTGYEIFTGSPAGLFQPPILVA